MNISRQRMILGIPVDNRDMEETLRQVSECIDSFSDHQRPSYIATINVDFLNNSLGWIPGKTRHPELLRCLRESDFSSPDGMPLVWISRWLGASLKERVTGADLIEQLSAQAAEKDYSVFFLGGREGIAQQAAARLQLKYPRLRIAGIASPRVWTAGEDLAGALDADRELVERINSSGAQLLFISLGNPKQEIWFHRVRHLLKVPVSIGIGGAYEFVAGTVRRAPVGIQKLGLEWIWRVLQEPRRLWRRYFFGFFKLVYMTAPLLLFSFGTRKLAEWKAPPNDADKKQSEGRILSLPTMLQEKDLDELDRWINDHPQTEPLQLDLSSTLWLDSASVAWLVATCKRFAEVGSGFEVRGLGRCATTLLTLYRVLPWIEELRSLASWRSQHQDASIDYKVADCGTAFLGIRTHAGGTEMRESIDSVPRNELYSRNTVVDLSQCSFLDNFALSFLVGLAHVLTQNGKSLEIRNVSTPVLKDIRVAGLQNLLSDPQHRSKKSSHTQKVTSN